MDPGMILVGGEPIPKGKVLLVNPDGEESWDFAGVGR